MKLTEAIDIAKQMKDSMKKFNSKWKGNKLPRKGTKRFEEYSADAKETKKALQKIVDAYFDANKKEKENV